METSNDIWKYLKVKKEKVHQPVDEHYFSNFQHEILKQINAEKKGKIIRFKPFYWIASAAAAVVFMVLTFSWFNTKDQVSLAHVSEDEIKEYLNQNPMHQETHHELASLDDLRIDNPGDTSKMKPGQATNNPDPSQKLASELPGFKSSSSILEELSNEELQEYIESEEIELEEEELILLNQ